MLLFLIKELLKHKKCKSKPKDLEAAMKIIGLHLYEENQKDSCKFYRQLYALGKKESECK